jgi:hypothetical protein
LGEEELNEAILKIASQTESGTSQSVNNVIKIIIQSQVPSQEHFFGDIWTFSLLVFKNQKQLASLQAGTTTCCVTK